MKTHDTIARIAYRRWEEAGKPCNDGQEFWYKAELELNEKLFALEEYIALYRLQELEDVVVFCKRWQISQQFVAWIREWL